MKKILVFVFLISVCSLYSYTQVIISDKEGVSLHPSAVLEINSDDKGFLLPRLTVAQRNSIENPESSLIIFNTDRSCIEIWIDEWYQFWCLEEYDPVDCGVDGVTFMYNGEEVTYGTVESQGRCWLDRNLGACPDTDPADYTGIGDDRAYGDLFQWGRLDDGHQIADCPEGYEEGDPLCGDDRFTRDTTDEDVPGHDKFIFNRTTSPFDWRIPRSHDLWQGVNGDNNPCPDGWRVPTEEELQVELDSWPIKNKHAAFDFSPLRLSPAGQRQHFSGNFFGYGERGYYWTSTIDFGNASKAGKRLYFGHLDNAVIGGTLQRINGATVRCIEN